MLYKIILYGLFFSLISVAQAGFKPDTKPLELISVQLRYLHQFQFAGFYAAIEQGYYKQAGLDVTLIEAKLGKKAVNEVLSGNAQYGQTQTDLLYYRLQGKPLVALAPILQHSPTVLMVRRDSNIHSPHELIGKRVMLELGDNAISTLAMLYNEGVTLSDINVIKQSYGIDELISGSVDAIGIYLTNRPFLLKKANIGFRILNPINYGIDFYGDTLFTTEHERVQHPDRVARFLKATLQGWQYAMANPEEIIDLLINQYGVTKSREHLLFEAQAMRDLMLPDLIEIGHMNPGRWKHMADIFVKQGKAPKNYSLDDFIYSPNKRWYQQTWIRYFLVAIVLLLVMTLCFIYYWQLSKRLKSVISERNAAEKDSLRLGQILEQSSNEIYIFDVDTLQFIQVNKGARQNLGYSMNELKGLSPIDLKPDYSLQSFTKLINPLQVGKQQQLYFETRHRRKNGSFYPVEVRLQRHNAPGQSVYYAIINDITDRQRINQELREKNTELERFIYMVSHDLKSPLVTIKAFLGYLQQDLNTSDADRVTEDIGFITTATNKMSLLLDDLLEFSRVGRQIKHTKSLSFEQLINDVLKLSAGNIAKQNIKIIMDKVDLTLQGDHAKLVQIWQNLLENAIKYMGDQANPQVEIGVQFTAKQPVFYVRDNGIGINPQYHEKVFEIFEQLDVNIEGSGLGLALIKRIVELYQGTIRIESEGNGQGSCFLFTLPAAVTLPPSGEP